MAKSTQSFRVVVREYNDSDLLPFTEYAYSVEAANSVGSTRSPVTTVRTPPGSPTGHLRVFLTGITATSAAFSWNVLEEQNGVIQKYVLASTTLEDTERVIHYEGLSQGTVVTGLTPFQYYTFTITACTQGGCLTSDGVRVEMHSAPPEGQGPVTIVPMNDTVLRVTWDPPTRPNGSYLTYYCCRAARILQTLSRHNVCTIMQLIE